MTFTEYCGTVEGCCYGGCPYYIGAGKRDEEGTVLTTMCRAPRVTEVMKEVKPREVKVCPFSHKRNRQALSSIDARIERLKEAVETSNQCDLIKSGYIKEIKKLEEHRKIVADL